MKCVVCRIEFDPKRATAKFCSPNCRVVNSRLSVTQGLSVTAPKPLSVTFKFTTTYKPLNNVQDSTKAERAKVREAKYWYNVPLGAIPVYEKGWPEMPDYMNGRQYFLWWKNEFKTNDEGEAVILSPYPQRERAQRERDNVTLVPAGSESRRWGA